jgi:hypothetical protein
MLCSPIDVCDECTAFIVAVEVLDKEENGKGRRQPESIPIVNTLSGCTPI